MLRIYWRSPLTKYYWWISKFTKSDFKFMEILTMSNESCQCDQISIHDNRRTYEGFFKRDFNFFYMLFHENVIEPPFGFNIFLQYAFNLYTRLSINVISRPYVSIWYNLIRTCAVHVTDFAVVNVPVDYRLLQFCSINWVRYCPQM
jgi:hypothetical protein